MKKIMLTIGILVVLVILAGCSGKQQTPEKGVDVVISPDEGESAPLSEEPQAEAAAPETTAQEKSGESLPEIKCGESQTLGYIGCANMEDTAELTIRNTGRADIDGVFIRFFDEGDTRVDQYSELFSMPVGTDKVVDIPLNNPRLWKVEVFPVTEGEVCINKQLVVIPRTNCR